MAGILLFMDSPWEGFRNSASLDSEAECCGAFASKVASNWQTIFSSLLNIRCKSLTINQASDGIRTRDLSITNRLHYLCATLAINGGIRECEKGTFATTI
jgi:hypothetical protein